MISNFNHLSNIILYKDVSVVTPFEYNEIKYRFRTVIQLDADIIDFIPDPDYFKNDMILYERYLKEQQKKVQSVINDLELSFKLLSKAINISSSILSFLIFIKYDKILPFLNNTIAKLPINATTLITDPFLLIILIIFMIFMYYILKKTIKFIIHHILIKLSQALIKSNL